LKILYNSSVKGLSLKLDICLDRLLSTLAQMFCIFYYSTLIKEHPSAFTQRGEVPLSAELHPECIWPFATAALNLMVTANDCHEASYNLFFPLLSREGGGEGTLVCLAASSHCFVLWSHQLLSNKGELPVNGF